MAATNLRDDQKVCLNPTTGGGVSSALMQRNQLQSNNSTHIVDGTGTSNIGMLETGGSPCEHEA
jgi:hypothetical protein